MVSKKSKIVGSVKVYRLTFVSLLIAGQLQPNFYKLSCVEQDYKTRLKKIPCTVLLNAPKS